MTVRIPYTKPSITQLEIEFATDAVTNGWGERCYEYITRFERSFAEHIGVDYAIATSSATGALHMGLAALGIGPGDEVILADANWIATAAPVVHLGATPVFVDVLEASWCIDPSRVLESINAHTKAIIATHLYGNVCEMDALLDLGRHLGIPIIEDSAEAIGSEFHGAPAGSLGEFSVFSFHGTKTVTSGEGGAFVTNNPQLYERVSALSNHGRKASQVKQFWPEMVGFKYKMSNVQAAIACAQLERIDELVQRKRQVLGAYRDALASYNEVSLNPEPKGIVNGAWMPTAVFSKESGITREHLMARFRSQGIDARVFFWPLSSLPMFREAETPVAHSLAERSLNLPSFHDITQEQIDEVVAVLVDALLNRSYV